MPVGGFERGPQDLRAKEFGHAAWLGGKGVEQKMKMAMMSMRVSVLIGPEAMAILPVLVVLRR